MRRADPTWHIVVLLGLALGGCFEAHGRGVAPPEPVPLPADAGAAPDSGLRALDAGPADAGACAELVAAIRAGAVPASIGCDGRTFPRDCALPVGACCFAELGCALEPGDGGHVTVALSCVDSCDQSCAAQAREDCAFFPYCEWFDESACGGSEGDVIAGPSCAPRRASPCPLEGPCPDGLTCRRYWVNPCLGRRCAACGAEASYCAP